MNRYRSPRSRRAAAVRTRRSSNILGGPVVAFLLVACFGILFAGCSNGLTIKGPSEVTEDDFTFTEEDVARFQELANESSADDLIDTDSGTVNAPSGTGDNIPQYSVNGGGTGQTSSSTPTINLDLSMVATYNAIRATPTQEAGTNTYQVTNAFLNVRSEPSTGSPLVVSLKEGDTLTVKEFTNGEWAKVDLADGKTGYVSVQYISKLISDDRLEEEKKTFANLYYVSFQFLNVRAAPNQGAEKLGEIPGRAFVRPVSIENGWAKISYQGKDGFVTMDYLAPFLPKFISRQDSYAMPIFLYDAGESGAVDAMINHAKALRAQGIKLTTLRDFRDLVVRQQTTSTARLEGKNAVIAVKGITGENVKQVSDALYGSTIPATLFIETSTVGVSGITQKTLQTLVANKFDIQSAGHTGDDLRSLTNAQAKLEVEQSRKILEDATTRPVFAILYPASGVNDRIAEITANAGYLFGVGTTSSSTFTRSQFLRLPSNDATSMTNENVLKLVP